MRVSERITILKRAFRFKVLTNIVKVQNNYKYDEFCHMNYIANICLSLIGQELICDRSLPLIEFAIITILLKCCYNT